MQQPTRRNRSRNIPQRSQVKKLHNIPRAVAQVETQRAPFFQYCIGPHDDGDTISKFVAPIGGSVGSLTFYINHTEEIEVDIGLRVSEEGGPTVETKQTFKTNKVNKMNENLQVNRGLIFELFLESDAVSVGDIFFSFVFEFSNG